jgi:hypothetical protein
MRHTILVLLALLAGSHVADACSCFGPKGTDILRGAAAVFRATAVKVEYLEKDKKGKEPRILVTFRVHEVWKGPERTTALLRTIYNKWTCRGYYFKAGGEYLVAAERLDSEGSETTSPELSGISLCGGTGAVEHRTDDLAALGPGRTAKKE